MLTNFLGIGDIREINLTMDIEDGGRGFKEDIAWYPLGIPINDLTVHEEACTMMIGK